MDPGRWNTNRPYQQYFGKTQNSERFIHRICPNFQGSPYQIWKDFKLGTAAFEFGTLEYLVVSNFGKVSKYGSNGQLRDNGRFRFLTFPRVWEVRATNTQFSLLRSNNGVLWVYSFLVDGRRGSRGGLGGRDPPALDHQNVFLNKLVNYGKIIRSEYSMDGSYLPSRILK
jgi:hypothetical protein